MKMSSLWICASLLVVSTLALPLHRQHGFCQLISHGGHHCSFNNSWMAEALKTDNSFEVAWETQHTEWVPKEKEKSLSHPISGFGSTVEYTAAARKLLLEVVNKFHIKTIFDAPCGDLNWMQIVWPELRHLNVKYRGADLSEKIIDYDIERFHNDSLIEFVPFSWDITSMIPPPVDLVIMRDVLFHLPVISAQRALASVSQSGAKYLLTTTFKTGVNNPPFKYCTLKEMGHDAYFYRVNLFASPFNLPQPIAFVDEPDEGRILGLWKLPLQV